MTCTASTVQAENLEWKQSFVFKLDVIIINICHVLNPDHKYEPLVYHVTNILLDPGLVMGWAKYNQEKVILDVNFLSKPHNLQ